MSSDPSNLEDELRTLLAAPLDDALLERLEAAVDGTWTHVTAEEARIENFLRASKPSALDPEFLGRLESVTAGVHFAIDEKVVLFPVGSSSRSQPKKNSHPIWAAAAAVALIGGLSALMVPMAEKKPQANLASAPVPPPSTFSSENPNFVPASFDRGLKEVHDEGVIWKSNEPRRVMKVVYKDHITYKDANGRTVEVEQPRVEYLLVPARTD